MTTNPYESPQTAGQTPERKSGGLKPTLLGCLAIGVLVLLVAFCLLPNVRHARPAARRMSCGNNLKQIGIALHNYLDAHGELPPAYTVDGKPLHSWRTLILPYMEHKELFDKIDLSKPWDDPANQAAFETPVKFYQCPSVAGPETHTVYLGVVTSGGCFRPTHPRKLEEITDDPGLTLMVVEVDAKRAVDWMSPTDATEQEILNLGTAKLPHGVISLALTVSGGVEGLSAKSKPETLRALLSIAGNDDAIAAER